jgi:Ser/Thr protein kinase RdoA (MazF antagonist)
LDDLLATLLAAYDLAPPVTTFELEHVGLNNVNLGVQTGAGTFVVRVHESLCYQDVASVAYEHALLTALAGQRLSFAVPVPLRTRDGAIGFQGPGGWTALTPKLPGAPLARQPYDAALLGGAIGEIQVALQDFPAGPRPGRPLFGELFQFGRPGLDAARLDSAALGLPPAGKQDTPLPPAGQPDALPPESQRDAPRPPDGQQDALFGWWRDEAASLETFIAGGYRALPWQVCHNDVTPNNVLAQDGVVTGLLDFEFATPATSAMDFVTGLRMVMQFWRLDVPWDDLRRFCQGYARWRRLTASEVAALPSLLRLRSAITVLWWIGRAAETGEAGPIPARIVAAQKMARWLEHHEAALLALISQEVGA